MASGHLTPQIKINHGSEREVQFDNLVPEMNG
jgi:hypothetical protein